MDWDDYMGSEGQKKLDAIQRQHVSDEACLKSVVEAFLLGEGKHQPSWRMLIHQLHKAGESQLAEKIKTNAEPHQGERACIIPQQCMHNISHMTSISNLPFCYLCTCLTLANEHDTVIKPQGVLLTNLFYSKALVIIMSVLLHITLFPQTPL